MRQKLDTVAVSIRRVQAGGVESAGDLLAVEEPLEIRINGRSIAVTMRTPGQDRELAAGFLFSEGILEHCGNIDSIECAGDPTENVVNVALREGIELDLSRAERNFYMTSSCGVCGKASIKMLEGRCSVLPQRSLQAPAEVLHGLPATLRKEQAVFGRTGGLHAAALFDSTGSLQLLREDVGRHNAVDKLIGAEFLAGRLPLHDRILLVSGRASFELVQKAVMAGIPLLAAVGAPSSLAVQTARRFGMTLLGFLREGRFNIYSGEHRTTSPR